MKTFSSIIEQSAQKSILVTGCDMYTGYMIAHTILKEKSGHFGKVFVGFYKENHLVHMLKHDGAEPVHLTIDNCDKIVEAYCKVDIVVVMPPVSDEKWHHGDPCVFLHAAEKAKVKGLVLCSKINIKELSNMPNLKPLCKMEEGFAKIKDKVEVASLVRCSVHIDMLWLFRHQIAEKHRLCLPAKKDAKFAPLVETDAAHGLCNMLLDPKLPPGIYELTGPDVVDFDKVVECVSSAIDEDIDYNKVDRHEMVEYLKHRKEICSNGAEFIGDFLEAVSKGLLTKKTDDLHKMLGKAPMSIQDYAQKNAKDFKPHSF
ncbi:hypothetical protein GGI25_003673 [Coemansia spiralis]|uniref:NmrA-like domain-containing protein n=2 Tax=Coemansia TaxID=4863 RepID=A0A9W8G5I3_9FUNG|nr:hypothetical protein BX070DRAFT_136056 [Coemansia spiralis]KAJ1991995.1 hypothetical protein EDC05_003150 [Coemansia umbellata]KAJ2625364.1 hypothetical protein GGI26_000835 [Coemansia sp. RSA 1358]KAJ2676167.1 hypothetical protein GGI25_003673 [Coemansia spiralis]